MLGLSGEVDKLSIDWLCDNLDPRSGERLTLRTNSDRTVGYDFNFHLPKGVSLAYSLGMDDRILTAFRDSVDETMHEIEREAKTRVRRHGVDANRTTGNLVWAQFIHKSARPVNGEPDRHVHAHCFVMNTTWDQKEQAWKAGQFRDLKRDAPYFEAAFHARMAMKMRELGYDIRREGKTWDIDQIPKAMTMKFSRRTDQIEELARKDGITSDAAKDGLGAKSREKKQAGLSMTQLRTLWNQRLDAAERDVIAQVANVTTEPRTIQADAELESASLSHSSLHCFERHSVVPTKVLLAEALRHGVGQVSVDVLQQIPCNGPPGAARASTLRQVAGSVSNAGARWALMRASITMGPRQPQCFCSLNAYTPKISAAGLLRVNVTHRKLLSDAPQNFASSTSTINGKPAKAAASIVCRASQSCCGAASVSCGPTDHFGPLTAIIPG